MSQATLINMKILLPFKIFAEEAEVLRIVVETQQGSFGILPRRLDCVTKLVPGILIYQKDGNEEVYVAVDQGILVKTGNEVRISVRNAISGTDLSQLHEAVKQEFLNLDEREQQARSAMVKLESGFLQRFVEFHHE